jgi:hypothetical protein
VLHKAIGHLSEDTMRKMAAHYNLKLKNKLELCSDCAEGKRQQKDINKMSEVSSDVPGEYLMINISRVKKKSDGGKKFWLLVLDESADKAWSFFLKHKDEPSGRINQSFQGAEIQIWKGSELHLLH